MGNDYANDQNRSYTDPAAFLARRAAACRAYFEHMPVWRWPRQRRWAAGLDDLDFAQPRIYQHCTPGVSWPICGRWTAASARSPSLPRPDQGGGRVVVSCQESEAAERTMLGQAQAQWLAQGLATSRRQWRLLAQSTQISSTGVDTPVGRSIFTDGWDGYSAARRQLLQTVVDAKVNNVVALGGDVRQNVAAQLRLGANNPQSPILAR